MDIDLLDFIDLAVDTTTFIIFVIEDNQNIKEGLDQSEAHDFFENSEQQYCLCSFEIENDSICLNVSKI